MKEIKEKHQSTLICACSIKSPQSAIISEVAKKYGAHIVLISRGMGGKGKEIAEVSILIPGTSKYPGQTGMNDNNFHFEDYIVSVSHMITGILCKRIKDSYDSGNYDKR